MNRGRISNEHKLIERRRKARRAKNRKTILIVAGHFVLLVGRLIGWNHWQGANSAAVTSSGVGRMNVGGTAPDFSVPTMEGTDFTLSANRGDPAIVFFMAYWCGTCIPESKALARLEQEYGQRLDIIAIDVDPSSMPEALTQFKRTPGDGDFTWAFDAWQEVA